jgi:hypothetical protein
VRRSLLSLVLALAPTAAVAEAVAPSAPPTERRPSLLARGLVFEDLDGDGAQGPGEPGRAGVRVFAGDAETVTDPGGAFTLTARQGDVVWARVPADARAVVPWRLLDDGGPTSLPLRPAPTPSPGPLRFAVAADTHLDLIPADGWDGADLPAALAQLTAAPGLRFAAVLGDLSQSAFPDELATVRAALAATPVPVLAVPGNHDWYDLGDAYRRTFGPAQYSVEVPGAHVVVWNGNLADEEIVGFLTRDLASARAEVVIALGHQSPSDALAEAMARLGVTHIYSGHWHARRWLRRGPTLQEWGVPPLTMGGVDGSPAGFALVTKTVDDLAVTTHATVRGAAATLVAPAPGACAAAELVLELRGPRALDARASIDCGTPLATRRDGELAFVALPAGLSPGVHRLEVGTPGQAPAAFAVRTCAPDEPRPSWSVAWPGVRDVGGLAVADGPTGGEALVVTTGTSGGGVRGHLRAVDERTGADAWQVELAAGIRAAPAIGGDVVVVVREDAVVEARALVDGAPRWTYALAAGLPASHAAAWAPPTIAGEVVYVAVQGRVAALAVRDGRPRWTVEPTLAVPWLGTRAAIAARGDVLVLALNRSAGLLALDARTGALRWRADDPTTIAIGGTPAFVEVDGAAAVLTVSAAGEAVARDLATGVPRWSTPVVPGGFDWGYVTLAPPAIAGDLALVPTVWGEAVALRLASGAVAYRLAAPAVGVVNVAHYRAATRGLPTGAAVDGDAWLAIDAAGTLRRYARADGRELASAPIDAPAAAPPVPRAGGELVLLRSGVLQRRATAELALAAPGIACIARPAAPPRGGSPTITPARVVGVAALAAVIGVALWARRRRRR